MFQAAKIIKYTVASMAFIGLSATSVSASAAVEHRASVEPFAVASAIQSIRLSDDGSKIGILRATTKRGDYILEVRDTSKLNSEPVKFGADKMEITSFTWLNNKKIMVNFRQNIQDGNRNYWVSKSAIVNANGEGSWRVPFPKDNFARYSLLSVYREDPNHVLLTRDINSDRIPDVVKFNINTGRTKTVYRGNEKVSGGFIADASGEIRAGTGFDSATTSLNLYARLSADDDWELIYNNRPEDREVFDFLYFSAENPDEVYVKATRGEDTAGIYTYNIKTKEYSDRLFGMESVDADSVILSRKPDTLGQLVGFSYTGKHPKRYFIDEYEQSLHNAVQGLFPGNFVSLSSRSIDDNEIVVYVLGDKEPGSYYLLTDKKDLAKIGETAPLIDREKLGDVKYVKYKARDGLTIPAYVTVPKVGSKPFPTIVHPHGGPWARDVNIYDEWSQLMASHGYLVIQPQFRGSDGFGMTLWKAGDKEWGYKMQDDLDDAAQFLVKAGLADPDRLAMFGWSYGGYASFVASMRDNNIYKCSVAGAGVSDLDRIGASINNNRFIRILQGPTVKGLNPLDNVEKVNVPILVVHGDIDQRVPVEHSRLFVDELKKHNKDFKYVELEGADHFSNTLYYEHKAEFYNELIDWFDNKCFPGAMTAAN